MNGGGVITEVPPATVHYQDDHVTIHHGNALNLPLEDASVDLVVTSPPYFGLRSYQDDGEHYAGQIGSEATPTEFLDALIAATAEMVRVLKPSGSIFVNLGDKYAGPNNPRHNLGGGDALGRQGIGVDLSKDYCRLAQWRCTDPGELAKAMRVEKPAPVIDGQTDLLEALS